MLILACNDAQYVQGQRIYQAHCQNCHMSDGSGLVNLIPSLHEALAHKESKEILHSIYHGINADEYGSAMRVMPSYSFMSATQLTNLINYLNNDLSSQNKVVTIGEMNEWLEELLSY
jgi:mono/diheme cytochrome c family protein